MTASLLFPGFDLPDDPAEARRYELQVALLCRHASERELEVAIVNFFAATGMARVIARITLRRCIRSYRQAMRERDVAWAAVYGPSETLPDWHPGYATIGAVA